MLSIKFEKCLFLFILVLFLILLTAYQIFPLDYLKEINDVALEMDMDPFLIAATIKLESNFNELALSHSGAFGLMQLMPDTANWLKTLYSIQGTWRDPYSNIRLGTYYLKRLLNEFESDFHHALNAYHMGPTKLKKLMDIDNTFRKSSYTKRIFLYRMIYKILYKGFLIYPGE